MQMFTPDPLFSGNAVAPPAAASVAVSAQPSAGGGFDALMAQHMSDRPAPAMDKVASDDTANASTVSGDKASQDAAAAPAAEKPAEPKAASTKAASTKTPVAKESGKESGAETAAPKAAASQATANNQITAVAEKTGKTLKNGDDVQDITVADVVVSAQVDVQPQAQPAPQPDSTATQVIAAVVQAVVAAVVSTTADAKQTQEAEVALTDTPAPEIKGRVTPNLAAPIPGKSAAQKPDAGLTTAPEAGDLVPATEEAFAGLLGKAVKGAAKSSGSDRRDDTASSDDGKSDSSQAPTTGAEPKAAVAKVRSVLEAFQAAIQPSQTADAGAARSDVAAAQPQATATADAATPTAFSLQSLQDTSGSYSATGSSTTAASNMSKAAVETLSALSMQISKRLSEGNTKFAIELHPADLGKVEVTLNIARDGKTTAHLRFDTPITAAAFSSQEGELRQQLAQTGLTFDKDSLSFSSRDGGAGFGASLADQQGSPQSQSQAQSQARQAARALEAAGKAADETDTNAALDAALANFRNRSSQSLALNLIV